MQNQITVLNVIPKDIYFVLELSSKQLQLMKELFDHSKIEFNSQTEPEVSEAVEFLNQVLYPFLKEANTYIETGKGEF